MFNPDARLTTLQFAERQVCHVIDDALLDPDRLVRYEALHAQRPLTCRLSN